MTPKFIHLVGICLLFTIIPFLEYLKANLFDISPSDWPVFFAWVFSTCFIVILSVFIAWKTLSHRYRLGLMTTYIAVSFIFFKYSLVTESLAAHLPSPYPVLIYFVLFLMIGFLGYQLSRVPNVLKFAFVFSIINIAVLGSSVVSSFALKLRSNPQEMASSQPGDLGKGAKTLPNIYYLILDTYGANFLWQRNLKYDNSDITDFLQQQGLTVNFAAKSSYNITTPSIESIISMNYPVTEHLLQPRESKQIPITSYSGGVFSEATKLGYKVIHAVDGGQWTISCGENKNIFPIAVDDHLSNGTFFCIPQLRSGGANPVSLSLLMSTPLFPIIKFLTPNATKIIMSDVSDLTAFLPLKNASPYLLFAHILLPHQPARFDEDCNYKEHPGATLRRELTGADPALVINVKCLNLQLKAFISKVRSQDKNAIIYITGDHGFGVLADRDLFAHPEAMKQYLSYRENKISNPYKDSPRQYYPEIALSILNAYFMPDSCSPPGADGVALVNSFRFIFNCVDGQSRPYLPYEAYFTDHGGTYAFKVTHLVNPLKPPLLGTLEAQ